MNGTRVPPKKRKHDPRHTVPDPYPVHYHANSYIVDQMCQCGQPRSQHADSNGTYGKGAAFNGKCERFRFNRFVEDPPWRSSWGIRQPSKALKEILE
jgi:hypothetical protein